MTKSIAMIVARPTGREYMRHATPASRGDAAIILRKWRKAKLAIRTAHNGTRRHRAYTVTLDGYDYSLTTRTIGAFSQARRMP